jgi:hypothetical protein
MKIGMIGLLSAVALVVWSGGCNVIGFIASPTAYEKKVPAEYELHRTESRILVFVDQARSSSVGFHVRGALDAAVIGYLADKVRVDKNNIIAPVGYTSSRVQAYAGLSPAQIGQKAGADLVLYIRIDKYELEQMDRRGYFNGSMVTRSVLVDVDSAKVLWPASQEARLNRIKVELETGGREAALNRLMSGSAHCITRYFYNCPGPRFRWGDEQKEYKFDNLK